MQFLIVLYAQETHGLVNLNIKIYLRPPYISSSTFRGVFAQSLSNFFFMTKGQISPPESDSNMFVHMLTNSCTQNSSSV